MRGVCEETETEEGGEYEGGRLAGIVVVIWKIRGIVCEWWWRQASDQDNAVRTGSIPDMRREERSRRI